MTELGWDMHCHTVFSDGTESPAHTLEIAAERGLSGVAIVDHDTIASWGAAKEASITQNYPLIRGSEITAEYGKTSVHILAYLYDCEDKVVADMFAQIRQNRVARIHRMIDLISRDYPITWDDVAAQIRKGDDTTIGRPHIADALVAAGVYSTRSEAFEGAVSARNHKYYVPVRSPQADDVVKRVKQAGGVVVIAHPGAVSRNKYILSDEQIRSLTDCGLDGLEVHHRDNPPEQQERLNCLAQQLGLLQTGGSDWHGFGKPNVMGENTTDLETVTEIIHRGKIRVLP